MAKPRVLPSDPERRWQHANASARVDACLAHLSLCGLINPLERALISERADKWRKRWKPKRQKPVPVHGHPDITPKADPVSLPLFPGSR